MKRRRIRMTLWLPLSCMKQLESEAIRLGVDRTKIVKIALDEYFQKQNNSERLCDQ